MKKIIAAVVCAMFATGSVMAADMVAAPEAKKSKKMKKAKKMAAPAAAKDAMKK
jgi:hypothetical protein